MSEFTAYLVQEKEGKISGDLQEIPLEGFSAGDVLIKAEYSGINYKDALGGTGKGPIFKRLPCVAGIDVAGVVAESRNSKFKEGDKVLINGQGMGENHDGGFSQYVRAPAEWLVPLPEGLSTLEAMTLGTAGFTAAICLRRMEVNGQTPDKGPIVVTGASGGVGSIAVNLFCDRGYEVIAVTGKKHLTEFLKSLGASQVKSVEELEMGKRPLEKGHWAGAVDNVGGEVLEGLLRHTMLWGNIASVGLAMNANFSSTVMPFILRGVSILGASSANCPPDMRDELWRLLGSSWKPSRLSEIAKETIGLNELNSRMKDMIDRKTHGRILVDCQKI